MESNRIKLEMFVLAMLVVMGTMIAIFIGTSHGETMAQELIKLKL